MKISHKKYLFLCTIVLCITTAFCEKRYDGFRVYTIEKTYNTTKYRALVDLQNSIMSLDFWSDPSLDRRVDIMVPPKERDTVEKYLSDFGMSYQVSIPDVQSAVEKERRLRTFRRQNRQQEEMSWEQYQRLDVIHNWMEQLANYNPIIARTTSIGKSTEGRDLKMIILSADPEKKNPIIFIDGGIHAREWISPSVGKITNCYRADCVTYIIGKLMSVTEPSEYDLLRNLDWYIIPVLNPDGYEYTHTEDRLWRKSRSQRGGLGCVGVDLNRNFDFHWGEAGVKTDPCANTYPGPTPLSEPEANATAQFLWANRDRIKAYLTFHSYSQLWLTPYGYTEELPEDYDDLHDLGIKATEALEAVHGTEYEVGAPSHILYANSGSSRDWVKGVAKIKYSFTVELPDDGDYGFLLPPEDILDTGKETWEAVKVVARHIIAQSQTESLRSSTKA